MIWKTKGTDDFSLCLCSYLKVCTTLTIQGVSVLGQPSQTRGSRRTNVNASRSDKQLPRLLKISEINLL